MESAPWTRRAMEKRQSAQCQNKQGTGYEQEYKKSRGSEKCYVEGKGSPESTLGKVKRDCASKNTLLVGKGDGTVVRERSKVKEEESRRPQGVW
jgi:hypothetical protein